MKKLASVMFTIALTVFAFAPSGNAQCCGDCNYSGVVTIDNLITAVNNGLDGCPPGSNNINLPNSTADMGNILKEGVRFIHNFGEDNTFVGEDAGNFTVSGANNTATGSLALESNTTGDANTAIGKNALQNNTTGTFNTATGVLALFSNTTGGNNTATGIEALFSNTTGDRNTAIGFLALGSSSGDNNTAIGLGAEGMLTTGNDNIYVSNVGEVEESNTIRIGSGKIQTDTLIAGISGATSAGGVPVLVNGEGQLGTTTSSRRFKQDVRDMGEASSALARLRPVTFRYKSEYDDGTGLRQYGLVAEEVAEVYPELVQYSKTEEPLAVRYHLVNAMLLNEVQKQQRTIEQRQEAIADLTTRLARLETRHPQIRQ